MDSVEENKVYNEHDFKCIKMFNEVLGSKTDKWWTVWRGITYNEHDFTLPHMYSSHTLLSWYMVKRQYSLQLNAIWSYSRVIYCSCIKEITSEVILGIQNRHTYGKTEGSNATQVYSIYNLLVLVHLDISKGCARRRQ